MINEWGKPGISSRHKWLILGLGAVCGLMTALVNWASDATSEDNQRYFLVLGYAYSFLTIFWITYQQNAETPSPRNQLLKAIREEVTQRLETSLHNQKMIDLAAKELPHHVGRMPISEKPQPINWIEQSKEWMSQFLRMPNSGIATTDNREDITAQEKIIDVFKNKDGKLLILGEPGAGKTTTLLDLAKDLCVDAVADENKPIPIIVDLFSWKDNRLSLPDWLAVELKNKYGVRADITKQLLDNHQLLPLLDGFDELEENRQVSCIRQINEFLETDARAQHLVVCSRLKEFERCNTPLRLNGAVCLQPLEPAQMQNYLREVGCLNLWDGIKYTSDLSELAKSPLLLTLMALASGSISISDWQKCNTATERRRYLFDAYIKQMFKREIKHKFENCDNKKKELIEKQHCKWLAFLAKSLIINNQTDFLIEKIQPNLINNSNLILCYQLILILLSLIPIIPFFVIVLSLGERLILGFLMLIMAKEILNYSNNINPLATWKIYLVARVNMPQWLVRKIIFNMLFMVILLSLIFVVYYTLYTLIIPIYSVLLLVICLFIILVLSEFTKALRVEIKYLIKPNQLIWESVKSAISFSVLTFLLFMIPLITSKIEKINFDLPYVLAFATFSGILFGFFLGGGFACIQHFSLRLVLWLHGDIPWNYAKFLNYASEKLFLQRIGGRYRFIHDLLREHFANM
ncbi:MAG TPA: NACHT domain-containing protein [Leptolyngbyaceae cyanobacterium]